jgi:predicted DCC family thiol-disulfide oxidoreductase YuxK
MAVVLRVIPAVLRDRLYNPVARNRYRWFGERPSCYLPQAGQRGRFL